MLLKSRKVVCAAVTASLSLAAVGWGVRASAQDTPAPTPAPPSGANAPAPPPAREQLTDNSQKPSHRFRIGPTVGLFLPTDGKTRDRFGSDWFSVGIGIGPVSGVTSSGQVGFDFNLLYQQNHGNHALVVPLGIGYRVALTKDTTAKTVPYAGITADWYLINIKSDPDNISGTYGAGGGSLSLGVNFASNANLEARYQFASKVKGFDFSGLNLTAGYRF